MRRLILAMAAILLAPFAVQAQDLATQTAQVEDLTSVREIKRLQSALGHLAIGGRWENIGALFSDDAVLQWNAVEVRGRDAIISHLRAEQGGGADGMGAGRLNLRLFISPVITLAEDGQSATGRWHEVALTGISGTSADWAGGTHEVHYRKQADGWHISEMRYFPQFSGPYADGWSHDAETLVRAPYHYTPDQAGVILPQRRSTQGLSQADIDTRATLLLGASQAQNTVNAFGYYLDRGMVDDAMDLFAENASIRVQGQGMWRGQDGARRFLSRFGSPGLDTGEMNDHPLLMPLVNVGADGNSVVISMAELGMMGQHGGEGFWSAALVDFRLVRGQDGTWRIAAMQRVPLMRSTYSAGWSDPLDAGLPIPAGGEADAVRTREVGFDRVPTVVMPSGLSLVAPASSDVTVTPIPGALAMAEAFDGAENVSNAYGYYIDQFAWPETAAVFADDGWKELSYIGTFITRERVLGSLIQRYGEGGPNDAFQAIHQKTQPFVTVMDGGMRAMVRTRLLQMNSSATGPGSWIAGIYENQIIKEDGIWRIHGMDLDYVWLADYADGWTEIDPAGSARFGVSEEVIAEFAPDAPLRGETFAPFPRIAPMGFHFANPVSGREPATRLHWSDGHRVP